MIFSKDIDLLNIALQYLRMYISQFSVGLYVCQSTYI